MTSNEILKTVSSRIKLLESKVKIFEERLTKLPEGNLHVYLQKGSTRYIHELEGKRTYLGKDQELLLKQLEEKAYYQKLHQATKGQIVELNKILKILEQTLDPESVFLKLKKEKRHLIEPYTFTEIPQIKMWQKKVVKQKDFLDSACLITDEGEKVRSKSELIIANKLHAAGIAYYYEEPTAMGEFDYYKVRPDFTVQNKRTGQVFFWEHLGMMDDPQYCLSAQIKLENYSDCGKVLGKDLIVTMESSKRPLSTELIDQYIKDFLL